MLGEDMLLVIVQTGENREAAAFTHLITLLTGAGFLPLDLLSAQP